MKSAMNDTQNQRDLLSSANNIQRAAEGALGGKFETVRQIWKIALKFEFKNEFPGKVVAFDDFAHKSHFKEGKSCKVEKDGQVALAWQPWSEVIRDDRRSRIDQLTQLLYYKSAMLLHICNLSSSNLINTQLWYINLQRKIMRIFHSRFSMGILQIWHIHLSKIGLFQRIFI